MKRKKQVRGRGGQCPKSGVLIVFVILVAFTTVVSEGNPSTVEFTGDEFVEHLLRVPGVQSVERYGGGGHPHDIKHALSLDLGISLEPGVRTEEVARHAYSFLQEQIRNEDGIIFSERRSVTSSKGVIQSFLYRRSGEVGSGIISVIDGDGEVRMVLFVESTSLTYAEERWEIRERIRQDGLTRFIEKEWSQQLSDIPDQLTEELKTSLGVTLREIYAIAVAADEGAAREAHVASRSRLIFLVRRNFEDFDEWMAKRGAVDSCGKYRIRDIIAFIQQRMGLPESIPGENVEVWFP